MNPELVESDNIQDKGVKQVVEVTKIMMFESIVKLTHLAQKLEDQADKDEIGLALAKYLAQYPMPEDATLPGGATDDGNKAKQAKLVKVYLI